MQISKNLNEKSRAVLFPHQFEAWIEFLVSAVALQHGGILNAVLDGNLSWMACRLSEKGRSGVAELRPHVREMILEDLQELEKKAVRELLRDESPETRDRIMKVYDALPPNWTPNFKALLSQGEGGLNGCTNCPPDSAEPKESLIGSGAFGQIPVIDGGRSAKLKAQSGNADPKKEQTEKGGGDRPDKN